MPGSGRPSKGCYLCRSKKVKCDEVHPECKLCQAAGVKCPGYRSQSKIVFRSMNHVVESKVKGIQKRKSREDQPVSLKSKISTHYRRKRKGPSYGGSSPKPISGNSEEDPRTIAPLFTRMSTRWEDPALSLFSKDYVLEADVVNAGPGFLENFPKLYGISNEAVLPNADLAVSLASFSNKVRSNDLIVENLGIDRKRFILQQLEYIGGTMGIKRASRAAKLS